MNKIVLVAIFLWVLTGCVPSYSSSIDDLTLTIRVDQSRGQVGKPIHITFTISRSTPGYLDLGPIEAEGDGSVMDIIVGSSVDPFARWSAEQPPDKIIRRLDLKPGESQTIELTWTPTVDNIYVTIQGVLKGKNRIRQDASVLFPVGNPIH